jgi:hypothetical protein
VGLHNISLKSCCGARDLPISDTLRIGVIFSTFILPPPTRSLYLKREHKSREKRNNGTYGINGTHGRLLGLEGASTNPQKTSVCSVVGSPLQ